jgi:hypothetical protein
VAEPVEHWSDIAKAAFNKLAPLLADHKTAQLTGTLEAFERDIGPMLAPIVQPLIDHPGTPEELQPLLAVLGEPEHFGDSIVIGIAIGAVLGPALGAGLAPFVQVLANNAWASSVKTGIGATIPLSPAEIALGVLRNNPCITDPYGEAAKSGISNNDLNALEYNTGEAPGMDEVMFLDRRGKLKDGDFERAVRESRYRDDWLYAFQALEYGPPTAAAAIEATVKGHLDPQTASDIVKQNGIDPAYFEWLCASAGRPPGIEEMGRLLNRDIVTPEVFREAVDQSDIQDRWTDCLIALQRYIPPVRTIGTLLKSGAIDDGRATTLYQWNGVAQEDIDAYIKAAHSTKAAAVKGLTESQVRSEYDDGILNAGEAQAALVALGYSAAEASQLIALADAQREQRWRNVAIGAVHTSYEHHRIDQPTASAELDSLSVAPSIRDDYIRIWNIERDARVVDLTVAQCQGAWHRGIMGDAEFDARMAKRGYSQADITYLKVLAIPPSHFPSLRGAKDV